MNSLINEIKAIARESEFQKRIIDVLYTICEIDTSPHPDIQVMKEREGTVFEVIKQYVRSFRSLNGRTIEKKIDPTIEKHPAFSKLHFTQTKENPEGLSAAEVYRDRHNLLYVVENKRDETGNGVALNAHIDVVEPFIPPKVNGDYLYARGAVDDKGNAAGILGALTILDRLSAQNRISLKNSITSMFVIEEEPGGNGSLDLATDKQVKALYDSVLVLETAGNNIYPANRGAVWFKCDLKRKEPVEQPRYDSSEGSKKELTSNSPSLLEAVIFAVLEMQKEGEAIKSESEHPLFPHKPVQTCNGILGPFGEHPSRICGELSFVLKGTVDEDEYEKIEEAVDRGIADYTARYGDKTQLIDPVTKQKKVDHHYDMSRKDELITIDVHGSAGHMGAILENDDAIVKWAYIAEKLFFLKENGKLDVIMELSGYDSANELTLEGGQGFLPTHTIDTVKERMARAFANGVEHYLSLKNVPLNTFDYMVSYDKLHNDAFDGDPDSPTMVRAWKSGIEAGIIDEQTPKRGWDVSSDARLFAKEYPEMPVITSGVGELTSAHSDNEHVFLPDLFKSIVFTVLFLLRETGSIEE